MKLIGPFKSMLSLSCRRIPSCQKKKKKFIFLFQSANLFIWLHHPFRDRGTGLVERRSHTEVVYCYASPKTGGFTSSASNARLPFHLALLRSSVNASHPVVPPGTLLCFVFFFSFILHPPPPLALCSVFVLLMFLETLRPSSVSAPSLPINPQVASLRRLFVLRRGPAVTQG